MAHLLRTKQSGVGYDYSANLTSDLFVLEEINRFGIASQVSTIAYDPVQSLVAVGTNATAFGPGQVYVFGGRRARAVFSLGSTSGLARSGSSSTGSRGASVRTLQFCSDKLVCLDSRNDLTLISLVDRKVAATYTPPGTVTAITSDPTLDYVILGTHHGEMLAFDIDRGNLAPFKLPNFWTEQNPRVKSMPIVSLAFHPRDIGTLLIGYLEGAVIYSFKQNKPMKYFQYHIPRGAPGGDADSVSINMARNPRLSHVAWHPTGTFILTVHEDSSLVFWDPKDGRVIMARTLSATGIDQPGGGAGRPPNEGHSKLPIIKVAWCANQDPDDTALLVAGGASSPTQALTLIELGRTPNYTTSTWPLLSQHFENPRKVRVLPTPTGIELSDFCLVPRSSPWFSGAHDPIAILATLSTGEIMTMSFPNGFMISPTNQLHVSMTFVHPFVSCIGYTSVDRTRWLGLTETRNSGPKIIRGGVEATHPLKRFADRSVLQTAHADGTLRVWDVGHADEVENETVNQADVARAVGRVDINVTQISLSGASGELAAGLQTGEVVVFRWMRNKRAGQEPLPAGTNNPRSLTDVSDRKDPSLVEGFHPFTLLDQQNGRCSALKVSDVGFVAAGFEGGSLVVIDLRGPAIIYTADVNQFSPRERHGPFSRRGGGGGSSSSPQSAYATALEFSVMTLDGESYSSILLHCGTSHGQVLTIKILPEQGGRYTAQYCGHAALSSDRVLLLHPLSATSEAGAFASPHAVAGLREGRKTEGVLVAVTLSEARIFKPVAAKGAHKGWDRDSLICDAVAVTRCREIGTALTCLFGDGSARAYSIPGLRELASVRVDHFLDVKRFAECRITATGQIIGWRGPSELLVLTVWGGLGESQSPAANKDVIFNTNLLIPPRPTISNFQWVSGTQYITPVDMDILIAGPDRPPSKRMMQQALADQRALQGAGGVGGAAASGAPGGAQQQQEGYWEYMQRQITERTAKLGTLDETVGDLGNASAQWSQNVSDYVAKQKRNVVMGVVKSKFGF